MTIIDIKLQDALEAVDGPFTSYNFFNLLYEGYNLSGLKDVIVEGYGAAKVVDNTSKHDGDGESVSIVFSLGDKFYKFNGYRSSYDGMDWDGYSSVREVFPRTVTSVVYEG